MDVELCVCVCVYVCILRYEDNVDKFELNIPGNWIQAEGSITAEGQFQGAGAGKSRTAQPDTSRPTHAVCNCNV